MYITSQCGFFLFLSLQTVTRVIVRYGFRGALSYSIKREPEFFRIPPHVTHMMETTSYYHIKKNYCRSNHNTRVLPNIANILNLSEESLLQMGAQSPVEQQHLDDLVEPATSRGYVRRTDVSKVVTALQSISPTFAYSLDSWNLEF